MGTRAKRRSTSVCLRTVAPRTGLRARGQARTLVVRRVPCSRHDHEPRIVGLDHSRLVNGSEIACEREGNHRRPLATHGDRILHRPADRPDDARGRAASVAVQCLHSDDRRSLGYPELGAGSRRSDMRPMTIAAAVPSCDDAAVHADRAARVVFIVAVRAPPSHRSPTKVAVRDAHARVCDVDCAVPPTLLARIKTSIKASARVYTVQAPRHGCRRG
mmetsp:Transcript_72837/g.144767  ORF Transcript_72837/g.144767 Transcript_72837/m.144767 type:complete len:217 (-) Transcript_72837:457-1107(-)